MRFIMNAITRVIALFSFKGKVSRSGYFLGLVKVVLMYIVICVIDLLLVTIVTVFKVVVLENSDAAVSNFLIYLGPGLGAILCCWAGLALSVRRCHDINFSGWYVLFFFVPAVNLIFIFLLFSTPSAGEVNPVEADS